MTTHHYIKQQKHERDKMMKFLLGLDRQSHDNTVTIDRTNIQSLEFDETEVIRILSDFQAIGYIRIIRKSPNNDLSMCATVELLSPCLQYFESKRNTRNTKFKHIVWEFIKFIIPVSISIVALLKSFGLF